MAKTPTFKSGTQYGDLSAAEMRHMAELASRVERITHGPGITISNTNAGIHFSLDPSFTDPLPRDKTVVLTVAPADKAYTMLVYPVRYKSIPPVTCITNEEPDCGIEIVDDPIVAYPDFGRKAVDYKVFVSATLTAMTTYLTAYYAEGTWQVRWPTGGGGGSVPVSIVSATAASLRVQPLKWTEDATALMNDGDEIEVKPAPDISGTDYTRFAGKPDVLWMFNLAGKLCIQHKVRVAMREPPTGVVFGECS